MAKWKLKETAYFNDHLHQAGSEIDLDNSIIPGHHMEPLDDDARELAKVHGERMIPTHQILEKMTSLENELVKAQQPMTEKLVGAITQTQEQIAALITMQDQTNQILKAVTQLVIMNSPATVIMNDQDASAPEAQAPVVPAPDAPAS